MIKFILLDVFLIRQNTITAIKRRFATPGEGVLLQGRGQIFILTYIICVFMLRRMSIFRTQRPLKTRSWLFFRPTCLRLTPSTQAPRSRPSLKGHRLRRHVL